MASFSVLISRVLETLLKFGGYVDESWNSILLVEWETFNQKFNLANISHLKGLPNDNASKDKSLRKSFSCQQSNHFLSKLFSLGRFKLGHEFELIEPTD